MIIEPFPRSVFKAINELEKFKMGSKYLSCYLIWVIVCMHPEPYVGFVNFDLL